ncbi:MAG: phosphate signaling complex protein PhoU [Methanosarcinaceae archaeon]|nr:phosphate signaling complex protein PhoU [Methanosarcinaceae archaeon]
MVREKYIQELSLLKNNIIQMGELSQKILQDSMDAFVELDLELANETIKMDDLIDDKEMAVEISTSRLLALQQPMAGDLRLIMACIRIAIDLERMSDLAVDIAELTEKIDGGHIKPLDNMDRMAEIGGDMLKNSIKAFETADVELAKSTAQEDEKVDKLFYELWMELMDMMAKDPSTISNASHLLFLIRYLERIADHASNICESVIYMATGERLELN